MRSNNAGQGLYRGRGRPKYGNRKVEYQGIVFDSKLELDRWLILQDAQLRGEICGLERQVTVRLIVNGALVCKMVLDFAYRRGGEAVFEDAKGLVTRDWAIKRKLHEALYGPVRVVTKANLTAV